MTEGHRACTQESWCFFKSLVVSSCPCGIPCCWRTTATAEGGKWSHPVERIPEWNWLNRRGQHWRPQKRLTRPPSGGSVAFPRWHPCNGLCKSLLRIPACENEDDHEMASAPPDASPGPSHFADVEISVYPGLGLSQGRWQLSLMITEARKQEDRVQTLRS